MKELNIFERVALGLLFTAMAIAVAVMIGWVIGSRVLIQVLPGLAPMQFNTALLLFLSSLSLILGAFRYRVAAMCLAAFVLLVSGATFVQYLANYDFGIDRLTDFNYIRDRTSHPGRMAPNTAICYIFMGYGSFLYAFNREKGKNWIGATLGVLTVAFAFVSIVGYLGGIAEAYGWEEFTDMAVHTAVGFTLIGFALFGLTVERDRNGNIAVWVIVPATIGSFAVTIFIWRAIEVQRIRAQYTGEEFTSNYFIVFLTMILTYVTVQLIRWTMRVTSALEEAKLSAEVADQSKTTLLRYVSHEIRNPLAAVIGFCEPFLGNTEIDETQKEAFECVHSGAIHIKAVVDDLLAVSRFDSKKIQLEVHEFDTASWIRGLLGPLKKRAEFRNINFSINPQENFPQKLNADASKLSQIVINLVENAYKFTPGGGNVAVYMYMEQVEGAQMFSIKVEDNGRGIPQEQQEKIFEPFFQVQSDDGKQGLGLGLSICKRFMELMDGKISFTSEVGKGTTFLVQVRV